ncbi:MAG: nucleotidyltransferase family protein [Prevotella sp.]|nr:nucleotidyltransferase family protein [Candidatus Prevotella equi]
MTQTERYFFELLQVAIGNRDSLSGAPTPEEWEEIYEMSKDQTMVGIAFKGVERLPQEQLPPSRRLRQWFVKADKIRKKNEKMNLECAKTCYALAKKGLHSCIIKGQANLRNYGPSKSPLKGDLPRAQQTIVESGCLPSREVGGSAKGGREDLYWYRTPGDIDVWAWSDSGKVSDVIREVKKINPKADIYYHHADCDIVGETETEVHYRPSWMCAPWRDRILQRFCNEHKSTIGRFPVVLSDGRKTFFFVPSVEFDAVYQLVHIYRHLFAEGIGLRQMLDYWTLLTSLKGRKAALDEAMKVISKLGMRKFAGAVMFVMQEVFGMKDEYLLCTPNEKEGRFLLSEIMLAGNFGHADERINVTKEENAAKWGLMKLRRNMRFLMSYPEEVICEPFFRVYHWMWRTIRLWRF